MASIARTTSASAADIVQGGSDDAACRCRKALFERYSLKFADSAGTVGEALLFVLPEDAADELLGLGDRLRFVDIGEMVDRVRESAPGRKVVGLVGINLSGEFCP